MTDEGTPRVVERGRAALDEGARMDFGCEDGETDEADDDADVT